MTEENSTDDNQQTQHGQVQDELEQMTELAKRTMADFQNYKRRQEEERKNLVFIANSGLLSSLLPILDNFKRAKSHMPQSESSDQVLKEWLGGIDMSINQLQKTLEEAGIKEINSLGEKFNPELHEALVEGPGEKDIITEELEKGYMLQERVLRHAKVKVGNGQASE